MFWTEEENQKFWNRNQIGYAEIAHNYPCCNVPTVSQCMLCDFNKNKCKNKFEIDKALIEYITKWLNDFINQYQAIEGE